MKTIARLLLLLVLFYNINASSELQRKSFGNLRTKKAAAFIGGTIGIVGLGLLAKQAYEKWLAKKHDPIDISASATKSDNNLFKPADQSTEQEEIKITQTTQPAQQVSEQTAPKQGLKKSSKRQKIIIHEIPPQKIIIREAPEEIINLRASQHIAKQPLRQSQILAKAAALLKKFDDKYAPPNEIVEFIEKNKEKIKEALIKQRISALTINGTEFYIKPDPSRKINELRLKNCIEKYNLNLLDVAKKYVYKVDDKRLIFAEAVKLSDNQNMLFDQNLTKQLAILTEKIGFSDYTGNNIVQDNKGKYVLIDTENGSFNPRGITGSPGNYCKERYLKKMLYDLTWKRTIIEYTQEQFANMASKGHLKLKASFKSAEEQYQYDQHYKNTIEMWTLSNEAKEFLENRIAYWASKCIGKRTGASEIHNEDYPFVDLHSKEFNYDGDIDLNKVEEAIRLENNI